MRKKRSRFATIPAFLLLLLVVTPLPSALASHDTDPIGGNLRPLGHIEEPASLLTGVGGGNIHTDIAFWGRHAFQGSWLGFNIRNISDPRNPQQLSFTSCTGNQGDLVVWDNIVVRSWNSPAPAGATCDGQPVPEGFEGLHVFDSGNRADPVLVAAVDLSDGAIPGRCGSHTATGVPDLENGRLLVYNSGSQCEGFDIVEVPLSNPSAAAYLRTEDAGRECHDTGVILGDAMMASCAGDNGFTTWSIAEDLENPTFLYSVSVPGVGIGHGAGFTWDGEVIVFVHEPGGGVGANCQASSPDSDKTMFFYDARTGAQVGSWTLPRPQSDIENCTLHNFNVVPLRSGEYVLVHGSYQSGTAVLDFTDPSNPVELAYSDPPPIPPPGGPFCGGTGCEIGGVWSSYWYNGLIYESNITEGLNIFRFNGKQTTSAMALGHLNPQTQEFTIP